LASLNTGGNAYSDGRGDASPHIVH